MVWECFSILQHAVAFDGSAVYDRQCKRVSRRINAWLSRCGGVQCCFTDVKVVAQCQVDISNFEILDEAGPKFICSPRLLTVT